MKKLLFKVVFLLDYVPRYGRVWRHTINGISSKPHWRWQPRGMWGISVLDHLNLLDSALAEIRVRVDNKNEA